MKYIGLDAGSVSVKVVLLDDKGKRLHSLYRRHRGRPLSVALELLEQITHEDEGAGARLSLSVTGSAGRLIGKVLGIEPVNEVVAFAYATRRLYPSIRTIIELGGEDSKLIVLDEGSHTARDFSMNSVCAAGTGSFLDQQAERLRLSIEEFSELSLRSKKPPRMAGRCSVFAKSDMIHLQQIATPVEDIVAGLCFAVARNFKGSIARGRQIPPPVSFQGGVAANEGMRRAFREILCLDELFVPEEHVLMGAIGAALKGMESGRFHAFDLSGLRDFVLTARIANKGHEPLMREGEDFHQRHRKVENKDDSSRFTPRASRIKAYLGVDVGSISTNLALIDEECRLVAKRYLMTAGRPIDAVKQGLEEIYREVGDTVEIAGVGTTGSGRYMIADYIGADIVKNEITAQATAAAFIDREVDTIFEIGGQDSKYISLKDGVIVDFEMNKACAAGTGSFLEEQAEKLNVPIKEEFEKLALSSENPCRLGERCTVFMENSLMANLQRGAERKDLFAGLAYSIVQNYINRVVCKRRIGERIFFQGGVAYNKSVVAAFEKYLGKQVMVPPDHEVTGAIGMALIAMKHMKKSETSVVICEEQKNNDSLPATCHTSRLTPDASRPTLFKGFGLSQKPYEVSSFECRGCPNVCEINRVKVEGEKGYLFYGGRCEKYDVRKNKGETGIPDLCGRRHELLWKAHLERSQKSEVGRQSKDVERQTGRDEVPASFDASSRLTPHTSRIKIGIPYVFYFHDFLPFWTTLLWELGFDVEVSPGTERRIVDLGLENVLSETCFPVKVAHGHIKYLIEEKVDAIFLPSFVDLNAPEDGFDRGFACPYTQTVPYTARVAFRGARFLTPVVDVSRGDDFLTKELRRVFKPYKVRPSAISRALEAARKSQEEFNQAVKDEGRRVIENLQEKALVIVGRAYNALDKGINLNISKKLSDLGVVSIPMDFLPLESSHVNEDWPHMYWRAGQRILSAARIIRANPSLFALYIGNFSCGPDSFISKYFEEEMSGKPYLHLEIDEHSADAGAITRCEAFLDSIENKDAGAEKKDEGKIRLHGLHTGDYGPRKVFIPRMSDHAFAIAGAFEYCGRDAEVLPEPTRNTVDLGKRYVSGKECYPCAVTTGDMVRKVMEPDFRPDRSAFFMPSGSGPCRFGQYNIFQKLVMKELGLDDVPVFAPNQDENFYGHLGIVGKDFALRSWSGIVAIELLNKCCREIRPYEKEKGTADAVYEEYLRRAYMSIRGMDGDIEGVLQKARREFERIPVHTERKPLIGVVGEIFVRSNAFSNENLVRRIEGLDGEAYLAPVEEWIYYVNYTGLRRVLIKKEWSGMINLLSKRFFQKRIERRLERHFKGLLKALHEPDTRELMEKASPYIHPSFEGEAILSIGKGIDLIGRRASGLVSAMPFGCMPGTIVSGLMRGLSADFGIPCLSLPYDGTESVTTEIQLEAFMDQAREYDKKLRAGDLP
jgi:predicted CoA-substrate-specific enzyme activase